MKGVAQKTHLNLMIATAILLVIFVSLLSLGWYYIISLSNEVNNLNTEKNNYQNESTTLENLNAKMNKISSQKDLIYESIPRAKDISNFIATIEIETRKYNLSMSKTSIGTTKSVTKTGSDYSQTINKQQYYEIPIQYEVYGKYEDLTTFVNSLSSLARLNSVTNLVVTADNSDPAQPTKVKAEFIITIYAKK